jgi:hypothetical protein
MSPSLRSYIGWMPSQPTTLTAAEIDKLRIDQLHAATLKASDSCFEMKKMCATLLVATGSLIAVFTNKSLSDGVFVAGLAVITSFWLADSVGYYYQRRLRAHMDALIAHHATQLPDTYPFLPALEVNAIKAAFNGSMAFYLLLAVPVIAGWILWSLDVIASSPPTTN